MSNVSTEQFEFLLSLLGAQAEALTRIAAALERQGEKDEK